MKSTLMSVMALGACALFAADGFSFVADGKKVAFGKATGVEKLSVCMPALTGAEDRTPIPVQQLRFAFESGDFRAILVYTLPADRRSDDSMISPVRGMDGDSGFW